LSDVESDGGNLKNGGGIKYVYRDNTWKQEHFTYDMKPQDFIGVSEPTKVVILGVRRLSGGPYGWAGGQSRPLSLV
jgi:hypothetical protein